jgi:NAD(P)-dependent dehydrogenase (short-subunit alcohol dehydrogenase family)
MKVTGGFICAKTAAQQMIKTKTAGSIILIASMSAYIANRDLNCVAYNASKAGVLQMARNLACEWAQYNIRVNVLPYTSGLTQTISPGYIETTMVTQLFQKKPGRKEIWSDHNPLGRISAPEEYRAATIFLLGSGSSFMTGFLPFPNY